MNIQANWTVTDQGPWQLIYNDKCIISLLEVGGVTSTEGYVFAGTQEECEAERIRLALPWASEIVIELEYQLIYKDGIILYFSIRDETLQIEGNSFFGTKEECDKEINRLGLTWPSSDVSETTESENV